MARSLSAPQEIVIVCRAGSSSVGRVVRRRRACPSGSRGVARLDAKGSASGRAVRRVLGRLGWRPAWGLLRLGRGGRRLLVTSACSGWGDDGGRAAVEIRPDSQANHRVKVTTAARRTLRGKSVRVTAPRTSCGFYRGRRAASAGGRGGAVVAGRACMSGSCGRRVGVDRRSITD